MQDTSTQQQAGHRFGYVRVSTAQQDGSEQWKQLQAQGIDAADIEEDHGITGRTMDRSGLEKLTGEWDEERGSFVGGRMRAGDVLTVTMLDRLGRNTQGMLDLATKLHKSGMHLSILNMEIDTSTAGGELLFTVMAGIARMESRIKAERATNGAAARRARGEQVGGRSKLYSDADIEKWAHKVQKGLVSRARAAREMGMSRSTFYKRVGELGISLDG